MALGIEKFNIKISGLKFYQHIFYTHIDNQKLTIFYTAICG